MGEAALINVIPFNKRRLRDDEGMFILYIVTLLGNIV